MAQSNYNWPINPTTVNSGPLQYEVDGVPTTVNEDTITPANSTPLPVIQLNDIGERLAMGSGPTTTATQRVVLPTDHPAIPTRSPVNTAGSYAEITNLDTTPQTFTVPANAVGFILETLSSNTQNIRWKIGAAASATSGNLYEPGRDSGFIPCSANISVAAAAGTNQAVVVQWILSS